MSKRTPIQSQHLFDYKLKGVPNEALKAELDADYPVPQLSLEGDWNPAAYRQLCTDLMKTTYDSDPAYDESVELCDKQEVIVPPRDGNDAPVRIWIYRPHSLREDDSAPAIVYVHGGGSIGGSLEDTGPYYAKMAVDSQTVVCGVGYRMVPFVRYPYTMLDTYVGVKYVAENAAAFGIDPERIALSGDSAGGYQVLATVAKLAQNDETHLLKMARVGVSQIFDYFFTEPVESMTPAESIAIQESKKVMEWMTGDDSERHLREKNPHLFPGLANDELLAKYPPFIIVEQEFDNFRTPSQRLAKRLDKSGRLLEFICYPGCGHGGGHENEQSDFQEMIDVYLKG
jgi:acetyl esterase